MRFIPKNVGRSYRKFKTEQSLKVANVLTKGNYGFLKKYYSLTSGGGGRPTQFNYGGMKAGVQIPPVQSYASLRVVERGVSILRSCNLIIKKEVFRQGGDWQPNFVAKCNTCGTELQDTPEECPDCKGDTFRTPNHIQKKQFEKFIKNANLNEQRLIDVLKELEEDLNIGDDAYLVIPKKVIATVNDEPVLYPVEIFRGEPDIFRKVTDERGIMGGKWWKCISCGHVEIEEDRDKAKELTCKECDASRLYEVHYVATNIKSQSPTNYYIKGEVLHRSKFSPTLLYGYSPILTLYNEAMTIWSMDRTVRRRFERGRIEGIMAIPTRNEASLKIFREETNENLKSNPGFLPFLATDPDARHVPSFIHMLGTLGDNQFIELKNELRERISALYGVSLVFQADTSTSGGLNNEGLQITITGRSVEDAQETYNDGFLPFLMKQFAITDFTWLLNPSEEEDKVAEVDLQAKRIANANGMLKVGYVPTIQDSGEFEYEKDIEEAQRIIGQGGGGEELFGPLGLGKKEIAKEDIEKIEDSLDKAFVDPRRALILEALGTEFFGSFEGMTEKQVTKVFNELLDSMTQPQGWSVNSIVRNLDKILPAEFERGPLERIVRTETTSIMNVSRSLEYKSRDPKGEFKYKWVGPSDARTTQICNEIEAKTKKGVSMEQLDKIIISTSKKHGANPRPKLPHINCRHSFIRVIPDV